MSELKVLQQWECCIIAVTKEDVDVEMLDLTAGDTLPSEYATIDKGKFVLEQHQFLKPGYVFEWKIVQDSRDTVKSIFEFRLFGIFTKADIDRANAKAEKMAAFFSNTAM